MYLCMSKVLKLSQMGTHACTQASRRTHADAHAHTNTDARAHAHTHARTHTCMRTWQACAHRVAHTDKRLIPRGIAPMVELKTACAHLRARVRACARTSVFGACACMRDMRACMLECVCGWVDGWMGGWVDGWMGGWIGVWLDVWMSGWVGGPVRG